MGSSNFGVEQRRRTFQLSRQYLLNIARKERICRRYSCSFVRPIQNVFARVGNYYARYSQQNQQGKQEAKEEPADQKFPYAIRIHAESEKHRGEKR